MLRDEIAEGAMSLQTPEQEMPRSARTAATDFATSAGRSSPSEPVAGETGRETCAVLSTGARRRQRKNGAAAVIHPAPVARVPRTDGEGAAVPCSIPGKSMPPLATLSDPAAVPVVAPKEHVPQAGGDLGTVDVSSPAVSVSPVAVTITRIRTLARERRYAIKQQTSINNRLGGTVRSVLGWQVSLPEKEREAIRKRAETLVKAIRKGQTSDGPEAATVARYVAVTDSACAHFDNARAGVEKELRRLAKELPVYQWTKDVAGFGELGLAIIVGEAGDIGSYANPGKLWKRLGLAPVEKDGKSFACSSWRRQGGLTAEDWTKAGYKPQRRAEMHAFIGDVLLRAQWRGDDNGGHPIGPYGQAYGAKKAEYLTREGWTPKRADMAARRYMTKHVIRDLWRAWREAGFLVAPDGGSPTATPPQAA